MKSKELKAFEKAKAALLKKYQAKRSELNELRKELEAVGINVAETLNPTTTTRGTRRSRKNKSYPELSVEAVKKFLGDKGAKAGDLVKHFGTKFSTAANQKLLKGHFTQKKEGVSVIWKNK